MIWFGTLNIPILFGVQVLSFLASTTETYFDRILTTFTGPSTTRAGLEKVKLAIRPGSCQSYCFSSTDWKMFLTNFDDFFWPRHHSSRPEAGKAENRAWMTWFCTWKTPTLFVVQFVLFAGSTAEKCFGWFLMTFSGSSTTGVGVVENRPQMTQFCIQNIPTQFVVQFLWFPIYTLEKCLGQILTTFSSLGTTRARKVENRNLMYRFCTWNIPTLYGVQLLSFPINTIEKCFGQILTTFLGLGTIRWLGFATETYPQILWCKSYHFPSVRRKNVLVKFWQLLWVQPPPK